MKWTKLLNVLELGGYAEKVASFRVMGKTDQPAQQESIYKYL